MADIKSSVLIFVKETSNVLSCPKDGEDVIRSLEQMVCLLSGTPNNHFKADDTARAAGIEFKRNHFLRVFERVLHSITVDWLGKVPQTRLFSLLERVVMIAPASDTFLGLSKVVYSSGPGVKQSKCINLLEYFLQKHGLSRIFEEQGDVSQPGVRDGSHPLWNDLISAIVGLPNKMANILKREVSDMFLPQNYVNLVATDILICLEKVHSNLKNNRDCSLQFLCQLFGRLCFTGYSEILWTSLLPKFCSLTKDDFTWSRICERLVARVPDRCVESVVVPLFKKAPWYGAVSRILLDSVLENKQIEFVLTKKLLLHRCFDEDIVLQNNIGYLAGSMKRRDLFIKVLKMLLEVWSDTSSLKHTSYEQHAYISRAILVCLSFMEQTESQENKEDLMSLMMSGVQCHLDSTSPKIRRLGMIVAESITKAIDPGGHKLEFDYAQDEETESMLKLLTRPTEQPEHDERNVESKVLPSSIPESSRTIEEKVKDVTIESDLDSDDDLVPYDMSNDIPQTKVKSPRYLRDCMEGLMTPEDPDRVEICLQSSEPLIRQNLPSLRDLSVEFIKILLHLDDKFNTTNFILLRHGAMVALTVECPTQVAPYITGELLERNYNIRQRLDILEVLAAAAKELSQPNTKAEPEPLVQVIESKENPTDWRAVVQKRIDSKTRRFAGGRVKGPEAVENKFAPVAGLFFFPLMKNFDRNDPSIDLLGDDCMVLSRLLFTLGVIMYAALHAPIVPKMSGALLEFLWVLRYHPDRSVRRGIIFALSMLILATPGFTLMTDLQAEILEARSWLEDVVNKDPDNECKEMAIQALVLLENTLKRELRSMKPD